MLASKNKKYTWTISWTRRTVRFSFKQWKKKCPPVRNTAARVEHNVKLVLRHRFRKTWTLPSQRPSIPHGVTMVTNWDRAGRATLRLLQSAAHDLSLKDSNPSTLSLKEYSLSFSTLSRLNQNLPDQLYEDLFGIAPLLPAVCPQYSFRFKNLLYSLDASTIDLCLVAFPWANFRTTKGVTELHVGLNPQGYWPEFVILTDGKKTDIEVRRTLKLAPGSMVAVDWGYKRYTLGIIPGMKMKCFLWPVATNKGITRDQTIRFIGIQAAEKYLILLRHIGF